MTANGRRLQDRIIDLIIDSGLTPGSPLPTENQLVDELGVGRNSVRESLRALSTLGIVDIRHGYGTFVGAAPITAFTPGLLFRARQSMRHDASVLRDLMEVRRVLEMSLVEAVVARADEDLVGELDALVAAMESGDLVETDQRFHETLFRPLDNEIALELIGLFWTVYHRVEAELDPPRPGRAEICHEHRTIVEAVRAGDPVAARDALGAHFVDIEERVARLIRQSADAD
ncbi:MULTISPECIES: FadR/GntR family transcriptional regulator [Actinoalloteichus]|uniref:Transcriptional regulator n=1 Tax=Actinoalloteichus fjordicus TaxID=1612552 RepID=A0AAC9LD22_9PSEU|nr:MULTISPECIES: FCD domain-containing protein [Actinoalloteichus]APU14084.1 transcriptional regulator [Actinoalloteichus fjordicus]APU20031.1 transcriptional regulator [Actinoalloteichus sp. GBA129-24]